MKGFHPAAAKLAALKMRGGKTEARAQAKAMSKTKRLRVRKRKAA